MSQDEKPKSLSVSFTPKLALELSKVTAERDDLLARNKTLEDEKFELEKRLAVHEGYQEPLLPFPLLDFGDSDGDTGLGSPLLSGWLLPHSASSPLSIDRPVPPPAPNDLDVFPNEVLSEILRHLHQPYHFHNYSLALLGPDAVSSGSKPWNPVGLQTVCRRWRSLSCPLFYCQLGLDLHNLDALEALADVAESCDEHPVLKARTVVLYRSSRADAPNRDWTHEAIDRILVEVVTSNHLLVDGLLVMPADFGTAGTSLDLRQTMFVFQHPHGSLSPGLMLDFLGSNWTSSRTRRPQVLSTWPKGTLVNASVTLCLVATDLASVFVDILESISRVQYLPHLQIDLPFALPASLLDEIFPTIALILQHDSLPSGRDFILKHAGTTKTIAFGTHSDADATALRTRIDALGQLEVVVEVVVLEM